MGQLYYYTPPGSPACELLPTYAAFASACHTAFTTCLRGRILQRRLPAVACGLPVCIHYAHQHTPHYTGWFRHKMRYLRAPLDLAALRLLPFLPLPTAVPTPTRYIARQRCTYALPAAFLHLGFPCTCAVFACLSRVLPAAAGSGSFTLFHTRLTSHLPPQPIPGTPLLRAGFAVLLCALHRRCELQLHTTQGTPFIRGIRACGARPGGFCCCLDTPAWFYHLTCLGRPHAHGVLPPQTTAYLPACHHRIYLPA